MAGRVTRCEQLPGHTVTPGNRAHILHVERTLESRKDSRFWSLPDTLSPSPAPQLCCGDLPWGSGNDGWRKA